jgi:hypothetical protein
MPQNSIGQPVVFRQEKNGGTAGGKDSKVQ